MEGLTQLQTECLEFIREFVAKNSFPPTSREIASHFGVFQTAAVNHLRALQRKGYITRQPNSARAIKIL